MGLFPSSQLNQCSLGLLWAESWTNPEIQRGAGATSAQDKGAMALQRRQSSFMVPTPNLDKFSDRGLDETRSRCSPPQAPQGI